MTLLSDLADDASRGAVPTPELLRRLKVIAARSHLPALADWVQHELSGYPDAEDLPPYRGPFDAEVHGDFVGPFGSFMENRIIPPSVFDQAVRDSEAFHVTFLQPVAELEVLARSTDKLGASWPADMVAYLNSLLVPGAKLYPGYSCHAARQMISPARIAGVLDAVRNRVLDLVLGLEQVEPRAGEAGAPPVSRERAAQIINNTVYGNPNIAIASSDFAQAVTVAGPAGEEDLLARLAELGVPSEEVAELRDALADDRESNGGATPAEPGPRVRSWLARVGGQAAGAAGRIGTGAAGGLVARAVADHYQLQGP